MTDKGTCLKHGEFSLAEGCPECLGKRRDKAQGDLLDRISELPLVTEVALKPSETATISIKPETNQAIIKLYDEGVKLQRYAKTRVIKTVEDIKDATDDLSVISRLKKAIEEIKKEYTGPINEHLKAVNDAFKKFTEPLNQADMTTRQKILEYRKEQDRIREEQERINQLKMDAAKAEMELKGELSESVDLVEVVPEPAKRISTDMGTSGVAKIWKFEVIDFSLLPDRFKMENATLIGKVVRAGEREIPGVKIWSEDTLRVTTK